MNKLAGPEDEESGGMPSRRKALELVLWYAVVGTVWLISSDWLLGYWADDQSQALMWDAISDCVFMAVTAVMLLALQGRYFRKNKQWAEKLQASEAHLRVLGDNLPDSYLFRYATGLDGKPRFSYISAGVERVHGLKPAEVLRDPECLRGLVMPEQHAILAAAEADSAENLTDFNLEIPVQHPDGTQGVMHLRSHPNRAADGTITWDGVATDITAQKEATEALRCSEERFRQLAENMSDVFWVASADMSVMHYVSPGYEQIWGRTVESLHANPGEWVEAIVPEEREGVRAAFAGLGERRAEIGAEYRIVRPDGSIRWIQDRGFQIRGETGKIIRRAGIASDITERKNSELALRQSEERFRVMFEEASIGMAEVDPHTGQFLWVNREMVKITGYASEELLGKRFSEITEPADSATDWAMFQQLLKNKRENYRVQKRYIRKDGQLVWVSVNARIVHAAAGQPLRAMASIEDISAGKAAEEERSRLVTAMEQSAESIMITDAQGAILYVNPAFEQISGYSRAEVMGQNPRLLKSGRQKEEVYQRMWGTLKKGEVWRGHLINKGKDGTLYEEEAVISPIRDSGGRVINYVAIKLDVTHEAELEGQLRQIQKMEAIGQLAGGVAHDFNNILAAMLMQTELIEMAPDLPEEVQDGLRELRTGAQRAASLTRQLLLFSRKQVMQPRDLDLNEIVTNLAKMLQRIIGEDVRLQLHLHPGPLMIHADPGMMDQILMNLTVNARDAMPGGGLLIIETAEKTLDASVTELQPDVAPGRHACLSVTDSGCGIAPEVLPHIFEPFFTTKEPGKGTGLGLATVFGIVKQHCGWINIASEPGKGATFRVFIPTKETGAEIDEEIPRMKPRGGTETILLVEDDTDLRRITRMLLERSGYRLLEASDGVQALTMWQEERDAVALLLTDLVMPGMTGRELAQKLMAENPALKVIFTSGYSTEIAGRGITFKNGEAFLQKPLQPDQLLKTIRDCLDGVAASRLQRIG